MPDSLPTLRVGTPLWATMMVRLVGQKDDVRLAGVTVENSVTLDVRPLLFELDAEDLLDLLNPRLGFWFMPPSVNEEEWFSDWRPWYDECVRAQDVVLKAQHEHDLATGRFDATPCDGEVQGVIITIDDPAAGWDWVATHAWHQIVRWGVDLTIELDLEHAFIEMNRPGIPPLVLGQWMSDVVWVLQQSEALPENTRWLREQNTHYFWAFGCGAGKCDNTGGSDCVHDTFERSKYVLEASQNDAAKWTEYLVGHSSLDPKIVISRVVEYVLAGVGAFEARRYEFGAPDDRPTTDALHTLGGLFGL